MLTLLLNKFWGYLVAIGAAVAAVGVIYLKGRSAGKTAERTERDVVIQKQTETAKQEVRDVETKIESSTDNAVRERARSKWVRK